MVHLARATLPGGIDAYALAPMQQGMLFHSAQESRGVDVQQVICELDEPIDPASWAQAWRDMVARHPVLRTRVEWLPSGEARQVINPPDDAECPFQFWEHATESEAHCHLAEYLAADRQAGFPSLTGPLLRVALIRCTERQCWMVVTYHHLIIDARSMTVLFREVFDRQAARVRGNAAELPGGPAYRDFVDWLHEQDFSASLPFWRDYLRGLTVATAAPGARVGSNAACGDRSVGELMIRVSPSATAKLRTVATREGVTLNTLAQAAWACVLSRYVGEDDVVFGAVRSGRHVPIANAATTLGLFINTVPVRSRFAPGLRVSEWLRGLRAAWIAMRPHEHTPLAEVQRCCAIPPGRRLFETLFNFQEPAWDEALRALGGKWAGRHFDIRSQPSYPLALDVYAGTAVIVKCFYERHRYDDARVAQVLGHFRAVLLAFAEGLPELVSDLPILSGAERQQLLEWSRGEELALPAAGVLAAVEAHAAASPAALAVADSKVRLTYRELNTRANRMAHRLIKLGVERESLVAVCIDRSAEMLIAWLAVWKAGGACVSLDPAYPADRLAFQIEDCGAAVVLTQTAGREKVSAATPDVLIVEVTVDGRGLDAESTENPALPATAGDLAYVIYTSGSTGQPKGVQVEHYALSNLVAWHQRTYGVTAADRATQVASPGFDASVWEIWPYLAAGASVQIPTDEVRFSPRLLWQWLAEKRISLSFLPTPLAEAVMRETPPADLALRYLLTGGDRLQRRPGSEFPAVLVNHYGPTECTVVATCVAVSTEESRSLPTIGRPIANTTVYVLDPYKRLAPPGVQGELYLGGQSLARGYWRRPALDAEKFVDVFVEPGAAAVRLYRTGDLVRWTLKGELEFLGRIDGQVKIRGCRIELGEIEAAVQAYPGVRETVVVARPDERGELQLVAYVAAESFSGEISAVELIHYLRERLPAYMVPAAVVRVGSWPLTANGKIDRSALPAPASAGAASGVAPSTAMERVVAKTWSEVLGRDVASSSENFFDLGGHSLLAAQVIARLNATLPSSLSVRLLFDHPTLKAFAREVEVGLRSAQGAPRPGPQRLMRRSARTALELAPPN